MTQTERITKMEALLDESAAALREFTESLERFEAAQEKIRELSKYYGSEEWFRDFDDSNSGRLPNGLKCGVLSEDAVYDLLTENRRTAIRMLETATEILK